MDLHDARDMALGLSDTTRIVDMALGLSDATRIADVALMMR